MTWNYQRFLMVNKRTGERRIGTRWWTVKIDPRGHFAKVRYATIMVCDKILKHVHRLEKPLVEVCMFLSCYPTF